MEAMGARQQHWRVVGIAFQVLRHKQMRQRATPQRLHELKRTSRHSGHSSEGSTAACFFVLRLSSASSSASSTHVRGNGCCSGERDASGRLGARISAGEDANTTASPRSCPGSSRSTLVCVVTRHISGGLGAELAQHEKASKQAMQRSFTQSSRRVHKPYLLSTLARTPPSSK